MQRNYDWLSQSSMKCATGIELVLPGGESNLSALYFQYSQNQGSLGHELRQGYLFGGTAL
jgi:hypothetical protein